MRQKDMRDIDVIITEEEKKMLDESVENEKSRNLISLEEIKEVRKGKIYKSEDHKINVIIPGDSLELPDDFFKIIVFIDNAYLIRLKNYFFKRKFKYNLKNFILGLAEKDKVIVEKIFIYDAPPFQTENPTKEENKKKEDYDKFADSFKKQGIALREGRTQRLKIGDKFVYKQKGVDMLLGIDAISAKNDFPKIKGIVLLTGDSDFVPLVEKLKRLKLPVFLCRFPFAAAKD